MSVFDVLVDDYGLGKGVEFIFLISRKGLVKEVGIFGEAAYFKGEEFQIAGILGVAIHAQPVLRAIESGIAEDERSTGSAIGYRSSRV